MGKLAREQINIDLFEEVKRLQMQLGKVKAEKDLLQAKTETQGIIIEKLDSENENLKKFIRNGYKYGYIDDAVNYFMKFL